MRAMMAGTHHIMVVVKDEATALEIKEAMVKDNVLNLSQSTPTFDLVSMADRFGGGMEVTGKGEYQITIQVSNGMSQAVARLS